MLQQWVHQMPVLLLWLERWGPVCQAFAETRPPAWMWFLQQTGGPSSPPDMEMQTNCAQPCSKDNLAIYKDMCAMMNKADWNNLYLYLDKLVGSTHVLKRTDIMF